MEVFLFVFGSEGENPAVEIAVVFGYIQPAAGFAFERRIAEQSARIQPPCAAVPKGNRSPAPNKKTSTLVEVFLL